MISYFLKQLNKKRKTHVVLLFIFVFFGLLRDSYGWGNKKTHPALTHNALGISTADSYLKSQIGLDDGILTDLYWDFPTDIKERIKWGEMEPEKTTRSILEWIKTGSTIEDEDGRWKPIRPRHHFHDPTRDSGLDNQTDHSNWEDYACTWTGFDLTGESALHWAAVGTAEKEPTTNEHYWGKTREEFYKALAESDASAREEALAKTFLNLGHVLHLIEDMGVPAHARNDFIEAHYRGTKSPLNFKDNPLEKHVEDEIEDTEAIPSRWLDGWTPQAKTFSKLAHYWDVNGYNGQYVGTSPSSDWGLSEKSNYQFLSKSTIFRKNVIIDPNTGERTRYYFPHPDVNHVSEHTDTEVYFWGLVPIDYKYISGYNIIHLARTKFIQRYAYVAGISYPIKKVAYHTTFDEAVYEDYAAKTLPRTIDYATGLVNYFFRGRLSAEPNCIDCNEIELIITNDSNNSGIQQTLKGGTFELYWDDADGNRAEVPAYTVFDSNIPGETTEWNQDSILEYGQTIRAELNKPAAEGIVAYILVYNGSISEDPYDPDPNDPNAIAVCIVRPGFEIFAWGLDNEGQVSDAPQGAEFIDVAAGKYHGLALKYDGSIQAWGWDDDGQCSDTPEDSGYIAIAAGIRHSIALKSNGSIVVWGDNSQNQITNKPSGNNFEAIAAGTYHSLALRTDGTIVGWGGWNGDGECDAPAPDPGTVYTAIAAGRYHSMALQSDGMPKAWGNNEQGQTRIYEGAAGKVHVAVAACDNYSLLLRDNEMLIAWGGGDDWLEPGIPRYHYRFPDGTDFVAIAAGWDHILALTAEGEILSWNWPKGDYPFDSFSRDVPDGVVFTEDISAGYDFSLALKAP